jgi:hypothetical protein
MSTNEKRHQWGKEVVITERFALPHEEPFSRETKPRECEFSINQSFLFTKPEGLVSMEREEPFCSGRIGYSSPRLFQQVKLGEIGESFRTAFFSKGGQHFLLAPEELLDFETVLKESGHMGNKEAHSPLYRLCFCSSGNPHLMLLFFAAILRFRGKHRGAMVALHNQERGNELVRFELHGEGEEKEELFELFSIFSNALRGFLRERACTKVIVFWGGKTCQLTVEEKGEDLCFSFGSLDYSGSPIESSQSVEFQKRKRYFTLFKLLTRIPTSVLKLFVSLWGTFCDWVEKRLRNNSRLLGIDSYWILGSPIRNLTTEASFRKERVLAVIDREKTLRLEGR